MSKVFYITTSCQLYLWLNMAQEQTRHYCCATNYTNKKENEISSGWKQTRFELETSIFAALSQA